MLWGTDATVLLSIILLIPGLLVLMNPTNSKNRLKIVVDRVAAASKHGVTAVRQFKREHDALIAQAKQLDKDRLSAELQIVETENKSTWEKARAGVQAAISSGMLARLVTEFRTLVPLRYIIPATAISVRNRICLFGNTWVCD